MISLGEIKGSCFSCVPEHRGPSWAAVFCPSGGLLGCVWKEARQTRVFFPRYVWVSAGGPYLEPALPSSFPPLFLPILCSLEAPSSV